MSLFNPSHKNQFHKFFYFQKKSSQSLWKHQEIRPQNTDKSRLIKHRYKTYQ